MPTIVHRCVGRALDRRKPSSPPLLNYRVESAELRAMRPKRLPVVLNREEVITLLATLTGMPGVTTSSFLGTVTTPALMFEGAGSLTWCWA